MKNIIFTYRKTIGLLVVVSTLLISCERELSDDAVLATFPTTGEVFTDAPVGLTDQFFESFDPATGANTEGFGTDDNVAYQGNSSIRIDVPSPNDANGSYIGGIFTDRGAGRNLTGYDALTFWAKGSTTAVVGQIGFGTDFVENRYAASIRNVELSTDWRKYIIPIPDPSKLTQEKGMFIFSAGTESTNGMGYTFWLDEIRFEKLGTIGQVRPAMFDGEENFELSFIGTSAPIPSNSVTFNLATGENVKVNAEPSYFDWTSSNPSVVGISDLGVTEVIGSGEATITATMAGVEAEGSLRIEVLGEFEAAPTPPARDPNDVISIFSDAYAFTPVDYYNGFFTPDGQTTQGGADIFINGEVTISYTDLNFVGIGTFNTVSPINANDMTHFHVDINVREAIQPGDFITIQLLNNVGGLESSGTYTITGDQLLSQEWASFDIALDDFGLAARNQLGLIFFISDATISDIYVDNIYYYRE